MKKINFKISNSIQELSKLPEIIDSIAKEFDLNDDKLFAIQLCLDEIITNTVNYGYPDGKYDDILIFFELIDEKTNVTIEDKGRPFNPLLKESPDINKSLDSREIGGLGIHFVKKLSKSQVYKRDNEKNILKINF